MENSSCPRCGSSVASDAVFCQNCGTRIGRDRPTPPPVPVREPQVARPVEDRSPLFETSRQPPSSVAGREVGTPTVVLAAALAGAVVLFIFLGASMNLRLERSNLEQARLQSRLNTINENYSSLSQEYSSLQANYSTLQTQYNSLKSSYGTLASSYDSLQTQYQQIESQEQQIQSWYDDVRQQVNMRLGNNRTEWQAFVTPTDALVESLVVNMTGGWSDGGDSDEFWSDVKRLYDWVERNVKYSYDSPCPNLPSLLGEPSWKAEYWRFPNETIRDKHGDCEDNALLLCSLIRSYCDRKYMSYCILIEGTVGHAAVAFPVGKGKLVVLDPAGRYFTGQPGPLQPKGVEEATDDWLSVWGGSNKATIFAVFNEDFHTIFSSNRDFMDWAIRS